MLRASGMANSGLGDHVPSCSLPSICGVHGCFNGPMVVNVTPKYASNARPNVVDFQLANFQGGRGTDRGGLGVCEDDRLASEARIRY